MSAVKRLTPPQSRKVNTLVKKECCNYINGKCLLLDDGDECVCPQLISYSLFCKWFRVAVLPADKLLYAELMNTEDKKRCIECGAFFASSSNSVKYCAECRKRITRRQAAARMKKMRSLLRDRGAKALVQCSSDSRFPIGQGLNTFSLKNGVLLRNTSRLHPQKTGARQSLIGYCAPVFLYVYRITLEFIIISSATALTRGISNSNCFSSL